MPNTDKPLENCLSAYEFEKNGRKYEPSIHGSYHMMIAAVSLAGPGEYTKEVIIKKNYRVRTMGQGSKKIGLSPSESWDIFQNHQHKFRFTLDIAVSVQVWFSK